MQAEKAVIFGATGGIGAALCRVLADSSVRVAAGSRSGEAPIHSQIVPFRFDLEDEVSIARTGKRIPYQRGALVSVVGGGHGKSMHRIAIYDLDGTLTRRKTFTPFLLSAARSDAPWRLLLLPVWIGCMVAYKLGIVDRAALKDRGIRLFLPSAPEKICQLAESFAARAPLVESVMEDWRSDGEAGVTRVIATAAIAPVAEAFGRRLGADHVLSTAIGPDGLLSGANNHGAEKALRVKHWLAEHCLDRDDCSIRMISDELHDAPLLDWADEGVLVTVSRGLKRCATARGWRVLHPR